jgi:hypothetical protein
LRTILLGADGPSPKAQGPELGQCCQDVLKFKSIHDCRELATGGPTAVATSIAAFSAALFGREETADSLVRFSEDGAKNAKKYFPKIL